MMRWTAGLLTLALAACATAGSSSGGEDRSYIHRVEIDASGASNAYDLIQSRRPTWLRTRGTQNFREQGQVIGGGMRETAGVLPGETTIVVYLNNAKLGGIVELRNVSLADVAYVRFLDAAAATQRWGGGHSHGAILVSTSAER